MERHGKIRFDVYEADLSTGELRKHGIRLRLQEKPFQVLAALLERPGQLVSREDLCQRLWSSDTFVDFDNNLNTAVYKLRESLNDTAETPRFIETLPKRGYRFVGRLAAADPSAPPQPAAGEGRAAGWRVPVATVVLLVILAASAYFALATEPSTAMASSRNPLAREAYFKGQYFLEKGGAENARQALPYFEEAIQQDSDFAEAHAALADALANAPGPRRPRIEKARAAAQRAVTLHPQLATAHHRLASIALYEDWNWEQARQSYERALALEPGSARLHHSFAGYFALMGQHDRALEEMQRAIELNPVAVATQADAGWYWFVARRYDEAVAQSKKALELDPQHRGAHYYILLALHAKGDVAEARRWAAKYLVLLGGSAQELARVNNGEAADGVRAFWGIRLARVLERVADGSGSAAEVALAHAALGDAENAITYLEKSYEEHSGWLLPFMRVYPPLDFLRTHPRFLALQQRMNFPAR